MGQNLSKLYYRDYYRDLDLSPLFSNDRLKIWNLKEKNSILRNTPLTIIENECVMEDHFQLKVVYPGLITGIGLIHEIKAEDEFKLGVHFDHTSGMPVIYGSSVKGVLKNAFKQPDLFSMICNKVDLGNSSPDINHLMMDIFEGKRWDVKDKTYVNKSIYQRDIFFDAVVVKGTGNGSFLDTDAWAPHGNSVLQEPVPINFLRIKPGTIIEFRFKLTNSHIGGVEITKGIKSDLFKKIITELGVGAKRNVGYGRLVSEKTGE